jgi:hypothetical protein
MKKLLTLSTIFMIALLSSCSNQYIEDGKSLINPLEETTAEVLQNVDTTKVYYVYTGKEEVKLVNKETNLVEYVVIDYSGLSMNLILIILIVFFVFFFIFNILNE